MTNLSTRGATDIKHLESSAARNFCLVLPFRKVSSSAQSEPEWSASSCICILRILLLFMTQSTLPWVKFEHRASKVETSEKPKRFNSFPGKVFYLEQNYQDWQVESRSKKFDWQIWNSVSNWLRAPNLNHLDWWTNSGQSRYLWHVRKLWHPFLQFHLKTI